MSTVYINILCIDTCAEGIILLDINNSHEHAHTHIQTHARTNTHIYARTQIIKKYSHKLSSLHPPLTLPPASSFYRSILVSNSLPRIRNKRERERAKGESNITLYSIISFEISLPSWTYQHLNCPTPLPYTDGIRSPNIRRLRAKENAVGNVS